MQQQTWAMQRKTLELDPGKLQFGKYMQCTKCGFRCSSRQSQGPVTDGYYNEMHFLYIAWLA